MAFIASYSAFRMKEANGQLSATTGPSIRNGYQLFSCRKPHANPALVRHRQRGFVKQSIQINCGKIITIIIRCHQREYDVAGFFNYSCRG